MTREGKGRKVGRKGRMEGREGKREEGREEGSKMKEGQTLGARNAVVGKILYGKKTYD